MTHKMKEAAALVGMGQRKFQDWIADHPADSSGVPYYVPNGNRKLFTDADIERILADRREEEARRLMGVKSCLGSSSRRTLARTARQLSSITSGGNTAASDLTTALELARRARRSGSSGRGETRPSGASLQSRPKLSLVT